MEETFDEVMERIRNRHSELPGDVKENEYQTTATIHVKNEPAPPSSPTKVFGTSSRLNSNTNEPPKTPIFKAAEPTENSPANSTVLTVDQSSARKARFSALAQELDDFECDFTSQCNKPKEAYMKGRSPRLSIGETRPSVLCTPAGQMSLRSPNIAKSSPSKSTSELQNVKTNDSPLKNVNAKNEADERRIKFAQPIVNVNYLPNESSIMSGYSVNESNSTIIGGSAEMMNVTTSSLSNENSINQLITYENTLLNSQTCDNRESILNERKCNSSAEYGAHTFMRKKSVINVEKIEEEEGPSTPTADTFQAIVSSPKPFSKNIGQIKYSPVNFTPKSTSSPKSATEQTLSPAKTAALESARAKTVREQFEQKLKQNIAGVTSVPVPTPRGNIHFIPNTISNTPHGRVVAHQKDLFPLKKETAPKLPGGVQTQWRGAHNTPVVQGAKAEEKTAGDTIVGAGVGRLKNLKSRWEFSSATGTPIHPDASEDSLIATAIRMKETAVPKPIRHVIGKKGPSGSNIRQNEERNGARSTTASPAAKSTRYEESEVLEDDVFDDMKPEENEEHDPLKGDEDESGDELALTDASRIIDQAFDFMERGSKMGTPSPYRQSLDGKAPIAQLEEISPEKRTYQQNQHHHQVRGGISADVIEEEDVPMGEEDEEEEIHRYGDDGTTIREEERTIQASNESTERKNESRLPYSVSFYRKIQKERVADSAACSTSIEPSAPPAISLTSPQLLKKLTEGENLYDSPVGRIFEDEEQMKERIRRAIKVEDEHISQSRRALALCRETPTFRESREEIEMQRALLIAVEKQRALLAEFERLQKDGPRIIDGPRGDVSITQLQVNLARDYVSANISSDRKSLDLHYFIAVFKWGEQVEVSKLITSDAAMNRKGVLDFMMPLQLKAVPADFRAIVEVYGKKSQRESFSHVDKYKLKGSTLKSKSKNTSILGGGTVGNASTFIPPIFPSSTMDSGFSLLGSFTFDINCPGKKIYQMSHAIYPLEGVVMMKVKKRAVDGTDILYKGFLSMYQRTREGLGSWTRYWCALDSGEMKFWKHPEDEGTKNWLVLLDLATCIRSEGASTVSDCCPYPNSFHIDVWVPKEDATLKNDVSSTSDIEQLRVMLAADTQTDLTKWLSVINSSSRQLCTWRNPIA